MSKEAMLIAEVTVLTEMVRVLSDKVAELDQRTWVGLTDEEMKELWEDGGWYVRMFKDVEAKLKEKNT